MTNYSALHYNWGPMAKDAQITIRLERQTLDQARELADRRGWTLSTFLTRAIERVVKGELAKTGTIPGDGTVPS